jgi:hypothetical protein
MSATPIVVQISGTTTGASNDGPESDIPTQED